MAPREDVMVALDAFLESEPLLRRLHNPVNGAFASERRSMICSYSFSCSPMHGVYHQRRRLVHSPSTLAFASLSQV